jgi:hypothetical protein
MSEPMADIIHQKEAEINLKISVNEVNKLAWKKIIPTVISVH